MTEKKTPFLRLVTKQGDSANSKSRAKAKRRRPVQLGLPYERINDVVLVNAERASSRQFASLLATLRPRWVIDVRVTPRFDTLFGGRRFALMAFADIDAKYVDLFGELGISGARTADVNPGLWSGELAERIRRSNMPDGPYLFLFNDPALLDAANWHIPDAFRVVLRRPIGIAADGLQLLA